jgi:hypothetical protein
VVSFRAVPAAQTALRVPRHAVAVPLGERDEAGGVDVDREQVVVRLLRLPVDPRLDRRAVAGTPHGVLDRNRAAVELEVALVALAARDDAMHHEPRVAQQVERLRRTPHHPEHQLAVDEVRLDGRDARPAVAAQSAHETELALA